MITTVAYIWKQENVFGYQLIYIHLKIDRCSLKIMVQPKLRISCLACDHSSWNTIFIFLKNNAQPGLDCGHDLFCKLSIIALFILPLFCLITSNIFHMAGNDAQWRSPFGESCGVLSQSLTQASSPSSQSPCLSCCLRLAPPPLWPLCPPPVAPCACLHSQSGAPHIQAYYTENFSRHYWPFQEPMLWTPLAWASLLRC